MNKFLFPAVLLACSAQAVAQSGPTASDYQPISVLVGFVPTADASYHQVTLFEPGKGSAPTYCEDSWGRAEISRAISTGRDFDHRQDGLGCWGPPSAIREKQAVTVKYMDPQTGKIISFQTSPDRLQWMAYRPDRDLYYQKAAVQQPQFATQSPTRSAVVAQRKSASLPTEAAYVSLPTKNNCAGETFNIEDHAMQVLYRNRSCSLPIRDAQDMHAYVLTTGTPGNELRGCWGTLLNGNITTILSDGTQDQSSPMILFPVNLKADGSGVILSETDVSDRKACHP
ncbi:hypothetical protein ACQUFY_06695 [Robbsia andropogonis]|uniref:hypothetical protein n=1 Tax=Robbsia andropogonis TaxID=28092 RepID=UPI003D263070